ncbi:MAG: hypothetical protein ACMUIP_13830 [bacterium]
MAELSAAALCHLIGKDGDKYLGNAYRYIESYASKANVSALTGCLLVIADVEKVLHMILMSGVKRYGQEICQPVC